MPSGWPVEGDSPRVAATCPAVAGKLTTNTRSSNVAPVAVSENLRNSNTGKYSTRDCFCYKL
jgi:hypothetical protein